MHFICVFDEDAKERLLALGFNLIKSDDENSIYTFARGDRMDFASEDISYVLSDTITF